MNKVFLEKKKILKYSTKLILTYSSPAFEKTDDKIAHVLGSNMDSPSPVAFSVVISSFLNQLLS